MPYERLLELSARLLVERPLWEPEIVWDPEKAYEDPGIYGSLELAVRVNPSDDSQLGPTLADDLDYFNQTLKKVAASRSIATKVELWWLPIPPVPANRAVRRLGPFRVTSETTPPLDVSGRHLFLPDPLYLSPRAKNVADLALLAITERLSPPPGAPETRGFKTLIFEEGPALITAAALQGGSGPVTLVCGEAETARSAKALVDRLNPPDPLEMVHSPLGVLVKEKAASFQEVFHLIIVSLSPYAVARRLKYFFDWLKPGPGRLIVTGMAAGIQTSLILKSAFKAGFSLNASATSEGFCVVNLARRHPNLAPIWDWTPGAWLLELTEDELSVLDEAEAWERKKATNLS
ncbi:MAG: hypothetical protein LBI10_01235 [Deltaproteobacteria bacterium]|nr:hypothetical protein [Deltaproteobacteria bacterium]